MNAVGPALLSANDLALAYGYQTLLKSVTLTVAAGEKVGDLRERLAIRLRDTKERIVDLEVALVEKSKAAARATDDFVHEEPWKAVGVAAAVGLALGVLIGRR